LAVAALRAADAAGARVAERLAADPAFAGLRDDPAVQVLLQRWRGGG
jgi:hypothetical protein